MEEAVTRGESDDVKENTDKELELEVVIHNDYVLHLVGCAESEVYSSGWNCAGEFVSICTVAEDSVLELQPRIAAFSTEALVTCETPIRTAVLRAFTRTMKKTAATFLICDRPLVQYQIEYFEQLYELARGTAHYSGRVFVRHLRALGLARERNAAVRFQDTLAP